MKNPKPLKCSCVDCILRKWTPKSELDSYRNKVLRLTNLERSKAGVPSVRLNSKLNRAAAQHNYDVAFNQVEGIRHEDSKGHRHGYRVRKAGYDYGYCSENIARGQADHHHVMRSWMKSPGHKKNILSPRPLEIGIHVGRGRNGQLYWTQVFGITHEDKKRLMKESEGAGSSGK